MLRGGRSGRLKILAVFGGVLLLGIVLVGAWAFPTLRSLYKTGILQSDDTQRQYNGNTTRNLRAIWTAVMLYHESEGTFPPAKDWMDAIKQHMRTSDMPAEEAAKKLVDPAFEGQPGKYGFALNDAVAGKYKGDIKDPKTPVIFESSDASRSAHGDPEKMAPNPPHKGGNLAITVDGTIVKLSG